MSKERLNKNVREGYGCVRFRKARKVKNHQMNLETKSFEEYQVVSVITQLQGREAILFTPLLSRHINPLDQMIEVEKNDMKVESGSQSLNDLRRIKKESETI
jgi:hypothetical protein